jgi:adenine deaminase
VENQENWVVAKTYIDGELVAAGGESLIDTVPTPVINHFHCQPKQPADFTLSRNDTETRAIEAIGGSLVTNSITVNPARDSDLATLVVVNRYRDAPVAKCFVRGFGIERGAIASSVGHDSHNILAVGADEFELCTAVNRVIKNRGGIVACLGDEQMILPLPVAGIMTTADGDAVASKYKRIDQMAKSQLGITLSAPFMTLSFMALLVIPSLKLSDQGLFDAEAFAFVQS